MDILNFHAQRGFAFVEEEALELTHTEKLKKEPPPPEAGDDRKVELVLSLLKHKFPTWSATEVTKCLHKAYVLENPGCGQDPRIVPKDVLIELVTPNEAKDVHTFYSNSKATKTDQKALSQRAERVAHYLPKGSHKHAKEPKKGVSPRWRPTDKDPHAAEGTTYLTRNAPSTTEYVQYDYNQRWRAISHSGQWKSVSWTRRGMEASVALSLHHGWRLHKEYTGENETFDMGDLHAQALAFASAA